MTHHFILDENIVILAHKQEDDQGNPDRICLDLMEQIIDICHPIVSDNYLWSRYQGQLSIRPSNNESSSHVLAILSSALRKDGKILWHDDTASFPEEAAIPQGSQDDVPIVRLAVATGAILVTSDSPLIQDLEAAGITQGYQLQVITPDQALSLL